MIDPHVHLRDWKQKNKETVKHGLRIAKRAGLSGIFEMPNTNPLLTDEKTICRRIELADHAKIDIFHGIFAGITSDPKQIGLMIKTYNKHFPRVVGFKLFAGKSTGPLAVIPEADQRIVFKTLKKLNYNGVLAVHCEKEDKVRNELFDPENPYTHTIARPPEAELESVRYIIRLAAEEQFSGKLHICHVSMAKTVEIINLAKEETELTITCGVTPHHLLLNDIMMKEKDGYLLKMNPPLRDKKENNKLLNLLKHNKIDWIETDHAPHMLKEKKIASGIPGFPIYPHLILWLKEKGFSSEKINKITHKNIEKIFGFSIPESNKNGELDLACEYDFDPYTKINRMWDK